MNAGTSSVDRGQTTRSSLFEGQSAESARDQAAGLRRLFEGRSTRAIAVVSNPAVAWSGLLIEHLVHALGATGMHTMVVDASETAPVPGEWASLDLRWAIDAFSYPQLTPPTNQTLSMR